MGNQPVQHVRAGRRRRIRRTRSPKREQPIAVGGRAVNTTLLRFENPSYGLVDASLGIAKDQWTAQIFGENLADRNVSLFTSTASSSSTQTPNRPRVLGLTDRLQVLMGGGPGRPTVAVN